MNLFQKTAGAVAAVGLTTASPTANAQPSSPHTEAVSRITGSAIASKFDSFKDPVAFTLLNKGGDPSALGLDRLAGLDAQHAQFSAKASGPTTVKKSEFGNSYRVGFNPGMNGPGGMA